MEEYKKKVDHEEDVSGVFPLNLEAALQHNARIAVLVINRAGLSLEVGMGVADNGVIIITLRDPDQHLLDKHQTVKCEECKGTGRTDNHVTGEVECSFCKGSGFKT